MLSWLFLSCENDVCIENLVSVGEGFIPDTVKVNEVFEIEIGMVFPSCETFNRVEEERDGNVVKLKLIECLFDDSDAACATTIRYDTLRRNLLFSLPGKYTIIVNDSAIVKEIEAVAGF